MIKPVVAGAVLLMACLVLPIAVAPPCRGADDGIDHAAHHAGGAGGGAMAPGGAANGTRPSAGGGMMGEMGKMMEMMSGPKEKDLYPSLMDLPDLPMERRTALMERARTRLRESTTMMSAALDALARDSQRDDLAAMQTDVEQLREAVTRFSSGIATQRALAEGRPPRDVALDWFKREMDLTALGQSPTRRGSAISWFHLSAMVVLVLFAVLMLWMYFFKMRRAAELLDRLGRGGGDGGDGSGDAAALNPPGGPQPPSTTTGDAASTSTAASNSTTTASPPVPAPSPTPPPSPPQSALIWPPTPRRWAGVLRVSHIAQESEDVKTFRLVTPDGGPLPFTYLPGQFITITAVISDKPVKRAYTIASSPTQTQYCDLTIKHEPHGLMSTYLFDQVQVGSSLEVSGPGGVFTFSGRESDSIVLIAGGVGITPMMSAVRYLCDTAWPHEIFLLYSVRTSRDFVFAEELAYLQHRHANLHVTVTATRADANDPIKLHGRFTADVVRKAVPNITNRRVHICGPQPMIDSMVALMREIGVPSDQVKIEAFGGHPATPTPVTAGSTPATTAAAAAKPIRLAPATVTFAKSGKSGPLRPDQTVLDVAESLGVPIEATCRVGICGSCRVKLLKGSVRMEVDEGLTPSDKSQNVILACQAKADAPIAVEV